MVLMSAIWRPLVHMVQVAKTKYLTCFCGAFLYILAFLLGSHLVISMFLLNYQQFWFNAQSMCATQVSCDARCAIYPSI